MIIGIAPVFRTGSARRHEPRFGHAPHPPSRRGVGVGIQKVAEYNDDAMKPNARIGLLGGTFNPIHIGHLLVAQDVMEALRLDCVKFIPAAIPPHKLLDRNITGSERLQMVRLAIRGCPSFEADDIEVRRGGPSYSVETVAELKRRHPDAEFFFIIGADSLDELPRWREARRLAMLCTFAVVARPGFAPKTPRGLGLQCHFVQGHPCDIASREVRNRLARGRSVRWLVPEAVLRYIQRHNLYQGKENRSSKHAR
ncbi:MAG: nicotinate (nicotinamide) nucleotide adenylyltransferase [Verrucomicrobia bacterium]|nr:nicotinate (nicotinamide) nucleotide adenylyltransferase [Verrucomicrobiota bacterium]